MNAIRLLSGLALTASVGLAFAAGLLPASDLAAEARQSASHGQALVVLYSRPDCKFCEVVRNHYLRHLPKDPERAGIVVRQIDQGGSSSVRDFKGKLRTHAEIAAEEKIKLVPVVAFYGPTGETLAPPIIGAGIADYYQSYLDEALDKSARQLKGR